METRILSLDAIFDLFNIVQRLFVQNSHAYTNIIHLLQKSMHAECSDEHRWRFVREALQEAESMTFRLRMHKYYASSSCSDSYDLAAYEHIQRHLEHALFVSRFCF